MTLSARTVSVSVPRDWRELYEAIREPCTFPRWASGLAKSELTPKGDHWHVEGPEGVVTIRFTPHNDFGVMDHEVDTGKAKVFMPMRVLANGAGAEVAITVYRQPDMTDEMYARDLEWVRKDLEKLKELFSA